MSLIAPDISEFQVPLTSAFNRRVLIMRASFGANYEDKHFLQNANAAAALYKAGQIDGVILYTVYLGSQTPQAQYAGLWKLIGPTLPDWLMAVMIDVEAWRGTSYSISGDHSRALNTLYGLHAHRMGTWNGCIGYGNQSDLAEIWPSRDVRCSVIVAAYGSRLVTSKVRGAIGQQYTDGSRRWPLPSGLSDTTQPFGRCDHNVFPGFANGKALRQRLRPVKIPTPVKPSTPPVSKPKPYVGVPALVSTDKRHALYLNNAGRLEVHTDGRTTRTI